MWSELTTIVVFGFGWLLGAYSRPLTRRNGNHVPPKPPPAPLGSREDMRRDYVAMTADERAKFGSFYEYVKANGGPDPYQGQTERNG
jgi:hypothetical protein